jgi:hypothetical protein
MNESQRESLLALIREHELLEEARLDAAGIPWSVVCREEEYGYAAAYGPCDPVQACEIAERMRVELEEEFPDGRWRVDVMRLSPAGDAGSADGL